MAGEGLRYSEGKLRVDLLPPEWVEALAEVMTEGAKKYEERNWEAGMDWSLCYAAALRHLLKFWKGQDLDEETGLPHVAHAAWNCLALLTYMHNYTAGDNRPYAEKDSLKYKEEVA